MLTEFFSQPQAQCFRSVADKVHLEYAEKGTFFLEKAFIQDLDAELSVFPRILPELLLAAEAVKADQNAAEYALFVYRAMKNRSLFKEHIALFRFPKNHVLLPLLCLLPTIRETYLFLRDKNIPKDIVKTTLGQYEACVFVYSKRYDRLGLNKRYFDWLQHYVDCEILDIDRLRFEIKQLEDPVSLIEERRTGKRFLLYHDLQSFPVHDINRGIEGRYISSDGQIYGEKEFFSEEKYRILIHPGDQCLGVHIPDEGDFSETACENSYERAKRVFASCFPEFDFKGFHCESWMMAPQLKQYLKPGSNILSFSGKFLKYPLPSENEDVLNFVFLLKFTSYDDLPEDTSLQRNLKKLYQSGGKLYDYGGLRYISG